MRRVPPKSLSLFSGSWTSIAAAVTSSSSRGMTRAGPSTVARSGKRTGSSATRCVPSVTTVTCSGGTLSSARAWARKKRLKKPRSWWWW